MVHTLENNYFLVRTKLGYLRYNYCFSSLVTKLNQLRIYFISLQNIIDAYISQLLDQRRKAEKQLYVWLVSRKPTK